MFFLHTKTTYAGHRCLSVLVTDEEAGGLSSSLYLPTLRLGLIEDENNAKV